MNRDAFYKIMHGRGTFDYEVYLNTTALLACQKPFAELCNHDELMFQIVHQAQELWMKLLAYTLLDIDEYIQARHTQRVLTLFRRAQHIQHQLINGLAILETMSPKEYQEIRLQLGNGSGQESPGFRTLLKMPQPLWDSFTTHYLTGVTLAQIYDADYVHGDAYVVAEALAEYDQLFQRFRFHHIQLIQRTIGTAVQSLKGRSVSLLSDDAQTKLFPELWRIRDQMTDSWGGAHGYTRESIGAT